MPPLVPSYNTKRIYATWVYKAGTEMKPGTYEVTVPVRITNATDDVIIPAGKWDSGTLNTTPGVPSLDIQAPTTNDPDNFPSGWQLYIEIKFDDGTVERYVLDVDINGPDINLRTVVLEEFFPSPRPVLVRGVPGGIAELDATGKVPLSQLPAGTGGGGGGGGGTSSLYFIYWDDETESFLGQGGVPIPSTAPEGVSVVFIDSPYSYDPADGPTWPGVRYLLLGREA